MDVKRFIFLKISIYVKRFIFLKISIYLLSLSASSLNELGNKV